MHRQGWGPFDLVNLGLAGLNLGIFGFAVGVSLELEEMGILLG